MNLLIEVAGPAIGVTTTLVRTGFWWRGRHRSVTLTYKPTWQDPPDIQADYQGTRYAKGEIDFDALDLELDYIFGRKERPVEMVNARGESFLRTGYASAAIYASSAMVAPPKPRDALRSAVPPAFLPSMVYVPSDEGMATSRERR